MVSRRSEIHVARRWVVVLLLLIGLLAAPAVGVPLDRLPSAVSAGEDDGEEDDDSGEGEGGEGNQGQGSGNGNEGSGNQGRGGEDATAEATADATAIQVQIGEPTSQAEDDEDDDDDGGGEAVAPVETYRVEVDCVYENADDQSRCTFVGVADGGGEAVRRIALPVTALCAPVIGGDQAFVTADSASRIPGGRAEDNREDLRLVLAGRVTPEGEATYWVTTDPGLVPARGPGFACEGQRARGGEATDLSDSAGAILVQALGCGTVTDAANFDWFGGCTDPAAGARFELDAQNGAEFVSQDDGTVAADGRLRFPQLPPGTYRLTQTSATWCHAESDAVDADGNVLVTAGQRASVWIFNCSRAPADATETPVK